MDKRKPQPQHKPPKKKKKAKRLEIEAAAIERGRIIGQFQGHKKKPLEESIKEHIGHWIDNIHIDPFEAIAMLGMTVLVHDSVMTHKDELQKLYLAIAHPGKTIEDLIVEAEKALGEANERAKKWRIEHPNAPLYEAWSQNFFIPTATNALKGEEAQQNILDWLISFAIAYVLIKHGGQILGLLGQGLPFIVGLMMA